MSPRSYRSPIREERARTTRARVLNVASELFLESGYTSTTLHQVAERASIALPTLTGLFRTKRGLLDEVVRFAVRGDAEEMRLARRAEFRAILEAPSSLEALRQWVLLVSRANERAFELFEILRKAAAAEPDLEAQRLSGSEDRYRDQARVARHLHRNGTLRQGVSVRAAADVLWFYSSADVHRMLRTERGWSAKQFESWLMDTVASALIPDTERLSQPDA